MKVVALINSLNSGGAERVVSTLTREWARRHQVIIALFDTSRLAYDYGGVVVDLGTPSRPSALQKLWNGVLRSMRIARVLRRERPDRIVSFMESANFPAIVASAMTGVLDRLCVSVHCNPISIPGLTRLLIPLVYRFAARVVAPSDGVREALRKMGLPARKLLVIPNPIANRQPSGTSAETGDSRRYILGVGRLEPVKGFDRLLQVFSKMERSDMELVILGDGTQRDRLLALSRELGITSRLHLPGVVSDVDIWYQHADCFVLTSHSEGFANVLVEAMANGCPVVSFDCAYGPSEILEGGRIGMLVSQDDIAGLSNAIQRLLTDCALRLRLARAGRQRARTFLVEKIAPRWLSSFDGVGCSR